MATGTVAVAGWVTLRTFQDAGLPVVIDPTTIVAAGAGWAAGRWWQQRPGAGRTIAPAVTAVAVTVMSVSASTGWAPAVAAAAGAAWWVVAPIGRRLEKPRVGVAVLTVANTLDAGLTAVLVASGVAVEGNPLLAGAFGPGMVAKLLLVPAGGWAIGRLAPRWLPVPALALCVVVIVHLAGLAALLV